jgi:methyl-accepting chemotaxis protein
MTRRPLRFATAATFAAAAFLLTLAASPARAAEEELTAFDKQVSTWAGECRDEAVSRILKMLSTGKLNMVKLFDTFYIPIPNTDPQKYHTQYDKFFDEALQEPLDRYLKKDKRLKFVVIVDQNGYLPTHNSRYSIPLTGNAQVDVAQNRTKRIFNDRTGLAAARNVRDYLLQKYYRDTGETMYDLSVPIFINDQHWGSIRFGYTQ